MRLRIAALALPLLLPIPAPPLRGATSPPVYPTAKPDGSALIGPYPKGPDHVAYVSGNRLPGCPDDDKDCDGWPEGPGMDCNDTDPNINPGMAEWPFDDYDDDCDPGTRDRGPEPFSYVVQSNPMGVYSLYQGSGLTYLTEATPNGILCARQYNYRLVGPSAPILYYSWMLPGKPFTYFWTNRREIWRTIDGLDIRPANRPYGPWPPEPLTRVVF